MDTPSPSRHTCARGTCTCPCPCNRPPTLSVRYTALYLPTSSRSQTHNLLPAPERLCPLRLAVLRRRGLLLGHTQLLSGCPRVARHHHHRVGVGNVQVPGAGVWVGCGRSFEHCATINSLNVLVQISAGGHRCVRRFDRRPADRVEGSVCYRSATFRGLEMKPQGTC